MLVLSVVLLLVCAALMLAWIRYMQNRDDDDEQ